jgi:hypothetical protein
MIPSFYPNGIPISDFNRAVVGRNNFALLKNVLASPPSSTAWEEARSGKSEADRKARGSTLDELYLNVPWIFRPGWRTTVLQPEYPGNPADRAIARMKDSQAGPLLDGHFHGKINDGFDELYPTPLPSQGTIYTNATPVLKGGALAANGSVATGAPTNGPAGASTSVRKWTVVNDGSGNYYGPLY